MVSAKEIVGEGSQLSEKDGDPMAGIALHGTATSAGKPRKTGDILSSTVMTWVWVAELEQPSVAVHLRLRI